MANSDGRVKLAICCEFASMLSSRDKASSSDDHIKKEERSLAKQIELSYSANRVSGEPLDLHVTGWGGDVKRFLQHIWKRDDDVNPWGLTMHEESVLEVFDPASIVFLSPDSTNPLPLHQPLERDSVYCLGGIIDRSVQKGLTSSWASTHKIRCYRLPVSEAKAMGLDMGVGTARSPVLNVSDVVSALAFFEGVERDWVKALDLSIPKRKRKAT